MKESTMLKLKLVAAILALAGMVSLLLGDTYLSVAIAVVCTAAASPVSLHLTLRWIIKDASGVERWFYVALWSVLSIAAGVSTLQDVNILNVPLGATIDYSQLGNVRYCVSFVGIISVILTVITPSCSSKRDMMTVMIRAEPVQEIVRFETFSLGWSSLGGLFLLA